MDSLRYLQKLLISHIFIIFCFILLYSYNYQFFSEFLKHKFLFIFSSFIIILITSLLPILKPPIRLIAFFHPYCDSGGGGERVFWSIINKLIKNNDEKNESLNKDQIIIGIYFRSNNAALKSTLPNGYDSKNWYYKYGFPLVKNSPLILEIKKRFEIDLINSLPEDIVNLDISKKVLVLIPLRTSFLLNPLNYPQFTLILQNFGSFLISIEAILRFNPNHWIDTTGFSFACIFPKFFGKCKTSAYIHYPVICKEDIEFVANRKSNHHNKSFIANSSILTFVKLIYYNIFSLFYRIAGNAIDFKIVNSSWTKMHIDSAWKSNTDILFPPCDFDRIKSKLKDNNSNSGKNTRENKIISLSQFRPEKQHKLQLEIFEELLKRHKHELPENLKFYLCGSTRNNLDEEIVNDLTNIINSSQLLSKHTKICKNLTMNEVLEILTSSKVALHTMVNEHFGISLLEFLASGLVVVTHNSGGAKHDILCYENQPKISNFNKQLEAKFVGFLSNNKNEYVDNIYKAFKEYDSFYIQEMLNLAQMSLRRFKNNIQFGEKACTLLNIQL